MSKQKKFRINDIDPSLLIVGKKLKDMDYSVNELAEILNLKPRYIREYLIKRKGAPTNKVGSEKGLVYINGKALYNWAVKFHEEHEEKLNATRLKPGEFVCFHCHKHVIPDSYTTESSKLGVVIHKAQCPFCGTQINRYDKGN